MYQMRLVIQELILRASSFNITAEEVRQAIKNYEAQFLKKDNEKEVVSLDGSLEDIVRRIIKKILQEEQGNQSRTARRLGISRTTLRRHLE
jgi:DNA-binding protein Fis